MEKKGKERRRGSKKGKIDEERPKPMLEDWSSILEKEVQMFEEGRGNTKKSWRRINGSVRKEKRKTVGSRRSSTIIN